MSSHAILRRRYGPAAANLPGTVIEVLLGAALLGLAALAGLAFVHHPWPNRLDSWVNGQLHANYDSGWAHHLTALGSLPALAVGVVVIFVVGLTRDWVRAAACAVSPLVAVVIVDKLAKPLVGRHAGLGGSSTYPSGTAAAVVALATAIVLVAPRLAKLPLAVLGVAATIAVSVAVVVLRWHYPTDVLGGMAVGMGSVLAIDGLCHLPWALSSRPRRSRPVPVGPGDEPVGQAGGDAYPTRGAVPG